MPRIANLPRPGQGQAASPQKHISIKMPLNDDREEKAIRLQSRHALHDLQMNQIKAAASPMRNPSSYERAEGGAPRTPGRVGLSEKEIFENGGALAVVTGTAVTPMKRMPILANFEEWMKMATDNKINATNSWNFALIDYFHDMSLLKEGDGVNFQKASCTLDGCVKIYTSRVDSVATETGKLLSGLADSGNKKHKQREGVGEDDENLENEEDEDSGQKKVKKRAQRSFEATLAPSFAPLSLKKFELEFSVDPLFKKASADFDEGGAKGLLLNHLAIDAQGRIVFDSSDDAEPLTQAAEAIRERNSIQGTYSLGATGAISELTEREDVFYSDINLSMLCSKFFPDLDRLDTQDICPSLKNLNLSESSITSDLPFLKAPEDWRHDKDVLPQNQLSEKSGIFLDDENAAGFDDDNEVFEAFDGPANTGFGEGGEAWARDAALEPQMRVYSTDFAENLGETPNLEGSEQAPGFVTTDSIHLVSTHRGRDGNEHDDVLNYFDNALQKNWAGPEHWKIRKMKATTTATSSGPTKRKEKESFEIDFASPLSPALADLIYTPASSNAAISLSKTARISKSRNLLPDDKHFNSRQLVQLFLKPKARIGTGRVFKNSRRDGLKSGPEKHANEVVDERFWAQQNDVATDQNEEGNPQPQGNYDANFFQDDGIGFANGPPEDDDEFADAREAFSPGLDSFPKGGPAAFGDPQINNAHDGAFGSQLVTQSRKLRPEYVQYARVAKKVDVRRLKQEMWKGLDFEGNNRAKSTPARAPPLEDDKKPSKFTRIMNGLQQVYPKPAMADISTSYCFICLLHLANEKGLTLTDEEGLEELRIRQDPTAEITDMAT